MDKNIKFFINQVTNNGETYFQIVFRPNGHIICSNTSLAKVAYRFYIGTLCMPTYKDGSIVVLNANSNENAFNQIVNQNLAEWGQEYDRLQKEMESIKKEGRFNYQLYMQMLSAKTEMQLAQQKRESLISK